MQDLRSKAGKIEFTRARARSADVLVIGAVLSDWDVHHPEARLFRYEHDGKPGEQWYFDDFDFHLQDITRFRNLDVDPKTDYLTYLSSEGDVYHAWWKGNFREKITGAGSWVDDAEGRGRLSAISQIGDKLYACGNGGQMYVRSGSNWHLLTKSILFDPEAHARLGRTAPPTTDPGFLQWLMDSRRQEPRNLSLHDIAGQREDAIYVCGVEGTKPVLCFWDGGALHELEVPLEEAALTGIHMEHAESVWVCGREGVLLHGSHARGFTPVDLRKQHNLFHMITPYRGKLVLPSSTRPGGLYELDTGTSELRRFAPALPKLRGDYIFHAESVGDVLWVVGQKDIFRFDGNAWERIEHPDL
ncbi:hypothetical protein CAL29_06745 [Bordetella genomosp. 10]|uniref:Uncharacterized protein n=1 Tax=Bordetella genomosp. 10 TaxID=1416804 RepID=A0A261SKV5_9BORD|nr:hypothetical protein [Bordetella genomosp. 10]OZI38044.1 hypothetical protein CAL29_06745 [Bordetella genomosp. 10]